MSKFLPACLLSVFLLAWASPPVIADTWAPARTKTTTSANVKFRVTVIPRPTAGALAYFGDKVDGVEPAGQDRREAQRSPLARVESLLDSGKWELVWQMPLVNDVAPVDVLLAEDGSRLVTLDNWHSMGYGDDVVVIYDVRGDVIRKLSLEDMLPPDYIRHLPRSVSSMQWRGDAYLVEGDRMLEIPIARPGIDRDESPHVPLRIRLSDGQVMHSDARAWLAALATAERLEAERRDAWEAFRERRVAPLSPPDSNSAREWREYVFELRDRIAADDEGMCAMALGPRGAEPGFRDAKDISRWVATQGSDVYLCGNASLFASPTSDHLADILEKALKNRKSGSMQGAHIVFVGTSTEGEEVAEAARRTGARITLVDRAIPFPAGEELPASPDPNWMPWP